MSQATENGGLVHCQYGKAPSIYVKIGDLIDYRYMVLTVVTVTYL